METVVQQQSLEQRLHTAVEQNQFRLHYQPQIERSTGRIVGAEALLRWQDPENGLVTPGHFLAELESTGLIVPVGEWVLKQATEDCRRWQRLGFPRLRLAFNVSTVQLDERATNVRLLDTSELRGFCDVQFEIGGSRLIQAPEAMLRALHTLRYQGVDIAAQNFGLDDAVYNRLWCLPVDALKIDRSFIHAVTQGDDAETVVFSMVAVARAFRIPIVAEGVETQAQLRVLARLRCPYSQGFLHGAPLPSPGFEAVLRLGWIALDEPSASRRAN